MSAELRSRIISALILTALAVAAVSAGGWITTIWVAAAVGFMAWELSQLVTAERSDLPFRMTAAASAALPAFGSGFGLLVGILLLPASLLLFFSVRNPIVPIGAFLLAACGLFFVWFRGLPDGLLIAFWVPIITAFTDMGGYFIGKRYGRRKLAPSISPKKTVEGAIGGIAAAVIAALLFSLITGGSLSLVFLAIVTGIAVQFGDLLASWVKRKTGVKDSGKLLPGHGGLIDRFDGLAGATLFVGLLLLLIPALRGLWG